MGCWLTGQEEQLNLQNNDVTEIPKSIASLVNLSQLVLKENKLEAFPEVLLELRLTLLSLNSNAIPSIPSTGNGTEPLFTTLEELDLGCNKLVSVPEDFLSKFSGLKQLILSGNALTEDAPAQVLKPAKLEKLEMSKCGLKVVPQFVYSCPQLESLDLSANKLVSFGERVGEFGALAKLELLDLKYNELTQLPDQLCDLPSLKELDVSENWLEGLPERFGALKCLKSLVANTNRVKVLPASFSQLGALQHIDLMFNMLTDPSGIIVAMKQPRINSVYLQSNMFTCLTPEATAKCATLHCEEFDPPATIVENVLYLGSYRTAKSYPALQKAKITQILTVSLDLRPVYPDVCCFPPQYQQSTRGMHKLTTHCWIEGNRCTSTRSSRQTTRWKTTFWTALTSVWSSSTRARKRAAARSCTVQQASRAAPQSASRTSSSSTA